MSNPTNGVWTFDGTLAGDTPSGPVSFVGVDPIRYDDGLWLEEAGTNLLANPSAESNASSNSSANGATVTRDLTERVDGVASFKVVTNGVGLNEGMGHISATGLARVNVTQTFPGVVRLKGSGTVNVWTRISYTDATSTNSTNTLVTLTSEWQECAAVIPTSLNTKTIDSVTIWARTNVIQAITFWMDAGQIDDNKPYRTSFIYGSIGAGYAFTGTSHLSASTRAASSASISPSGIFDTYLGAIVFVATPTIETGAEEIWGELGEKSAGTDHIRWGRDATKHPYVEWSGNDSAYTRITLTPTVDAGDEHFYSIEWHVGDTDFRLYLDDDPSENDTIPSPQEDYGAGPLKLQATAGGVIYGGLAICSERLTNDQRARLKVVMENRGNIETALDSKRGRYGFFQVRPKVE